MRKFVPDKDFVILLLDQYQRTFCGWDRQKYEGVVAFLDSASRNGKKRVQIVVYGQIYSGGFERGEHDFREAAWDEFSRARLGHAKDAWCHLPNWPLRSRLWLMTLGRTSMKDRSFPCSHGRVFLSRGERAVRRDQPASEAGD